MTTDRDARIRELIRNAKPMSAADWREQMVSFVYGNVKLDCPDVTRADVERAVALLMPDPP